MRLVLFTLLPIVLSIVIIMLPAALGAVLFGLVTVGCIVLAIRKQPPNSRYILDSLSRSITRLTAFLAPPIAQPLENGPTMNSDTPPSLNAESPAAPTVLQPAELPARIETVERIAPEPTEITIPPHYVPAGDIDLSAYLASINWQNLLYLVGILSLLAIALLTSMRMVQARAQLDTSVLPQSLGVLGVAAVGMGIICNILLRFRKPHFVPETGQVSQAAPSLNRSNQVVAKPTLQTFFERHGARLLMIAIALYCSWNASILINSELTLMTVVSWVLSIVLWIFLLYDKPYQLFVRLVRGVVSLKQPRINFHLTWTMILLIVIIGLGAWLRFSNLSHYPPDPNIDHYDEEMAIQYIVDGHTPLFFPVGGREPLHYYVAVALQKITGWPVNMNLIKLTGGLEGLLLVPLAFWMCKTILEDESPQLANLVGLIMAFFVATAFWTILLSRDGTRAITGMSASLLVITWLVRALRHNRRSDFMAAGFFLGVSLYTYSASRVLPIIVAVGLLVALIAHYRTRQLIRPYIINSIVLILMSVVVFVPMGSYALQQPDNYWTRVTQTVSNDVPTDPNANINMNEVVQTKLQRFADNMLGSALLLNWSGDERQFYSSVGGDPILDPVTSSLFVLGLGLLIVRSIKRRDPGDWIIPIAFLLGLVPSALVVGTQVPEGPAMFRILVTVPTVFYAAALMLGIIIMTVKAYTPWYQVRRVLYLALAGLVIFAWSINYNQYFVKAYELQRNVLPTQQAAEVVGNFNKLIGTNTNTYLVYIGGWLTSQMISVEAGDPQAIGGLDSPFDPNHFRDTLVRNFGTPNELHPDRPIMILVAFVDTPSQDAIKALFPNASMIDIATEHEPDHFKVFIVPPVGCDWLRDFASTPSPNCMMAPTPTPATP